MTLNAAFEGYLILVGYVAGIGAVFFVGGIIADYIMPMIRPLTRWIRTLPAFWDRKEGR